MSQTQFSIRTLLAAVAAVGIGAALWTAEPSWQVGAIEALLLTFVPTSAVLLCVSSTGRARAFWTGVAGGCILPTFESLLYSALWHQTMETHPVLMNPELALGWVHLARVFKPVLLYWAFSPVIGLLCVFTHWLLIRPSAEPKD